MTGSLQGMGAKRTLKPGLVIRSSGSIERPDRNFGATFFFSISTLIFFQEPLILTDTEIRCPYVEKGGGHKQQQCKGRF